MLIVTLIWTSAAASVDDSVARVRLGLHSGAGIGFYRDEGVSPLMYRGFEIHPGISVEVSRLGWRFETMVSLDGGAYGLTLAPAALRAYGGQVTGAFRALRRVHSTRCGHLWAGAGVDDLFDLRYNPQFGNSSVGISNFARLNLLARAEAQLRGWLLWGQAAFTPLSLLYRPGYSYISNFDRDAANPVDCAFDQYQLYCAAATGLATELGIERQLANGNGIGLTYRWHHLTSRTTADRLTAPHRFDQASHALMIQLQFKIQ